jgi:aspartyl-tRNA(Asn)/glutamyl-tRNA(Gln) amidotransferase subunit B
MTIKDGWEMVIGLEVHAELATNTKLFCGCANHFGSEPNTNICPVCLGLPGALPVLNEQAVEFAMRVGAALHCEIRPSIFSRKNYFYPDMPKDFQVTQYDLPLNSDGYLDLPNGIRITVERAHMEEDTGKSTHFGGTGRIQGSDGSLVDYNRSGVPLVEIVSGPDLRTAEDAKAYVAEMRGILVATGASDGKMEEGSMRVDANVSVRKPGAPFGTRCEIKNLNSLRSLLRAIDYEANRQIDLIESGERITQETRHWSEDTGRTSSMRSKEEAMDYRYFPEPDLVPLVPSAEWIAEVFGSLPLLPGDRRQALSAATGWTADTTDVGLAPNADQIVTVVDQELDALVLDTVALGGDARRAINRAANELAGATPDMVGRLTAANFAALLQLETDGKLTSTQAKAVLADMLDSGGNPAEIASTKGFEALDTSVLEGLVDELIAAHPAEFARLQGGDPKVAGFFVGAAMKRSGGKADGKAVTALLRSRAGLA